MGATGAEGLAATKTYTTALAVVALIVGLLTDHREILDGLHAIPAKMRETLKHAPWVTLQTVLFPNEAG